ncbi:Hypothetical predicted protein [Pelobates cultripes]|uniref:Uncharacterized protein n=1 Tax=Pelobates cultripes TaxID=61616 RepID=A0AAD1WLW2_PELCU|nr:Hypothetical predicted protein [Pelobates cultripes]
MAKLSTPDNGRRLPDLQLRLDKLLDNFWRKLESRMHPPASQQPNHLPKTQPQRGRKSPKVPTAQRASKWWRTKRRTLHQHKKPNIHEKHHQGHKAQMESTTAQVYLAAKESRGSQRLTPLLLQILHGGRPLRTTVTHKARPRFKIAEYP